jgi:flagellar motor switch protein FliM
VSSVLSNEQIAAMVAAAGEGNLPEGAPRERTSPRGRRVRDIDLLRPQKFAPDQIHRVNRAHEVFCRGADRRLSAELRVPVEFEVIRIDELTWSNAMAEVPRPSIFSIVEIDPMGTRMVVSAELPMITWMMECLLGGGEEITTPPSAQRDLTEIERALARRILGLILEQLSITWEELMGVRLNLHGLETHVSSIQVALPSEPTLGVTIEVRMRKNSWTMSIAAPYPSIAGVVDRLSSGLLRESPDEAPDPANVQAVRTALSTVEVEMRAEVAATELTIGQVLELRPGDVLRFGLPASAGVALCADTVPVHRAKPGKSGSQRAVEILEPLEAGL